MYTYTHTNTHQTKTGGVWVGDHFTDACAAMEKSLKGDGNAGQCRNSEKSAVSAFYLLKCIVS